MFEGQSYHMDTLHFSSYTVVNVCKMFTTFFSIIPVEMLTIANTASIHFRQLETSNKLTDTQLPPSHSIKLLSLTC